MRKITVAIVGVWLLLTGQSYAATKSRCPEKVIETATVEGIFQGIECGDFCYAAVKLENGEVFTMFCDEEKAARSLGKPGTKVSVTYEVQQFWNESGNDCTRSEVFKSGGPAAQHDQTYRKEAPLQLGMYQQCTGSGTTVESKCFEGNTLSTTSINPIELGENGQGVYIGYRSDDTYFKFSHEGNRLTFSENMKYIVPTLQIGVIRGIAVLYGSDEA